MKETDIEVLRQIVSRTDKTGNQKVEMLVEFVEKQLKNCNLQNVSQQRELLYGFSTWHNAKPQKERYDMIYVAEIEEFLKP